MSGARPFPIPLLLPVPSLAPLYATPTSPLHLSCVTRSKETLVFCDEWLKVFVLDALAEEVVVQDLDLSEEECITLGIDFESIEDVEATSDDNETASDAAGAIGSEDRPEETHLFGGAPSARDRTETSPARIPPGTPTRGGKSDGPAGDSPNRSRGTRNAASQVSAAMNAPKSIVRELAQQMRRRPTGDGYERLSRAVVSKAAAEFVAAEEQAKSYADVKRVL